MMPFATDKQRRWFWANVGKTLTRTVNHFGRVTEALKAAGRAEPTMAAKHAAIGNAQTELDRWVQADPEAAKAWFAKHYLTQPLPKSARAAYPGRTIATISPDMQGLIARREAEVKSAGFRGERTPAVQVRAGMYRGAQGFHVRGGPKRVRIFAKTKTAAERIRQKVKLGKQVELSDFAP